VKLIEILLIMADRDCEFLRSGNSASQERTHTGDNPYECDVCKKRFTQSRRLVLHIKRTHTRDTPYIMNVTFVKRDLHNQAF
jgi:KRAB domain-containing zinc finger protein